MWWERLGFTENPLDIRPSKYIINYDNIKSILLNSVESGYIVLLYGPLGIGKTSMLLYIRERLIKKGYCVRYINADRKQDLDIESLIDSITTKKLFGFIRIKKNCKIVLLIDEFHNLDLKTINSIKYFYDSGKIHSIIIAQVDGVLKNAPTSFVDRVYLKIEMKPLPKSKILDILKSRLGDKINLINKEILDKIIENSNKNLREIFLKLSKYLQDNKLFSDKEPIRVIEDLKLKLSDQQLDIIRMLMKSNMSAKELSDILNIPYNSISKQLSRLVYKGILEKEIEGNTIKYKISDKYKHLLEVKLGDII